MPDKEVKTIRDLIYYQYAKIITCRAFNVPDGQQAKKLHYGFIKKTFHDLKSGGKSWSHIEREDWQLVEAEKKCAYCGSTENLTREHIVPKSLHIKPDCPTCDHIQSIHNEVWACGSCNSSKGTMGLYEFYHDKILPDEPKYFDYIPELVEKKYLKTIMKCHECAGTLDAANPNGDRELSVLDIDAALRRNGNE
ncbi:MAG TPA: hypothetical protein VLX91_00725 [Candidatus Acidoferrales bacterium]|nr:hypothetical protein [Candidatus Acidoferrales bacterium]